MRPLRPNPSCRYQTGETARAHHSEPTGQMEREGFLNEKDGVTIIPAATVQGGGGGGGGEGPTGQGKGEGGGFGLSARPAGAYVINNGEVTWQPAVDVNRVVAVGGAVAMVAFLTLRSIVRARAKARRAND